MSCLILGWLTPGGKSHRDSHPLVLINSEEGVGANLHFHGAVWVLTTENATVYGGGPYCAGTLIEVR